MRLRTTILGLGLLAAVAGCATTARNRPSPTWEVADVDLSTLADGVYEGRFAGNGCTFRVSATVRAHRLADVKVLEQRTGRIGAQATAIIPAMLKRQTPNVDAVTGATVACKALMKAVEAALRNPPRATPTA